MDRFEMLKKFLDEDPNDPFNWYALALETEKSDPSKALRMFEDIIARWPNYLPVYFQAARVYEQDGRIADARQTLEKGALLARQTNDHKTYRELMGALDTLE